MAFSARSMNGSPTFFPRVKPSSSTIWNVSELPAGLCRLSLCWLFPHLQAISRSVNGIFDKEYVGAVSRIFSNIISNAMKYSDGDFTVTMTDSGSITFTNTAKDLNPVTVGRLFDRFYTVDAGRNSTGLGLSIAKLLTERMGGSIVAEYQESKVIIVIRL